MGQQIVFGRYGSATGDVGGSNVEDPLSPVFASGLAGGGALGRCYQEGWGDENHRKGT